MANTNPHAFPPIQKLIKWAHVVMFPGLNDVSLYEISKFFIDEFMHSRLKEHAAAVTYNFLMAMPPTLLFLFSLLPYLPFKHVDRTIFNILMLITPNKHIYVAVRGILADFMAKHHANILSYGIMLVLFFASNGVMSLLRCFDKSLHIYKKRTWYQRRWKAIRLTIMLIFLSILTLTVLILQSKDLNPYILKAFHNLLLVKTISGIILLLLVFVAISLIYTYGPSLTHRFRFISAGSVFATAASVIATSIFYFLVNHFLNYNKVYGSIGTLIAFMVWVWLNTTIVLLGYELNVSILLGKLSKEVNNG